MKVKSGNNKLLLLPSDCERKCFLIEVYLVFEKINLVPSLTQIIISFLESECKFTVGVNNALLLAFDVFEFSACLFLSDLNPLSLLVFVLIIFSDILAQFTF